MTVTVTRIHNNNISALSFGTVFYEYHFVRVDVHMY